MRSKLLFHWFLSAALVAVILASATGNRADRLNRRVPVATATSEVSSLLISTDSNSSESSELNETNKVSSDVEVFSEESSLPHLSERIVGGKNADCRNHPYQLQLAVNGRQSCGASIISMWWAITAAHCLIDAVGEIEPPESVTLRAGATFLEVGGTVHNARKVIVNKNYDDVEYDYDIALLKVRQPFQYGPTVQRILLPQAGEGVSQGTMGMVTGWGFLKAEGKASTVLQKVALPIISQKKCKASYKRRQLLITERMICAGFPQARRDFCQGDSGGPLVVDGKLIGIVSWSISCDNPGFPGVFTKVAKFRHWIKEKSGV